MILELVSHRNQSVNLFIHGKGKIGYLTGSTKAPKEDDHTYQT